MPREYSRGGLGISARRVRLGVLDEVDRIESLVGTHPTHRSMAAKVGLNAALFLVEQRSMLVVTVAASGSCCLPSTVSAPALSPITSIARIPPARHRLASRWRAACLRAYRPGGWGWWCSGWWPGGARSRGCRRPIGAGLTPKGPDPQSGKGSYVDPVTGEQRILVHPDGAGGGHAHVNNPEGERLDINGQVVPPESPEAHLPIKK
jgi:hypothetical protein